ISNVMEKNEVLKNAEEPFERKPLIVSREENVDFKVSKYLKWLIFALFLGGMLISNACIIGKSTKEPTFIQEDNKQRQKSKHRVFVAGHWSRGSKGKHWVRGHWERK
ncbi:MAG: hypothetical protein P1P88_10805, partial [Bacteroidales bacterium]|nr:hypothetical protein [Bacteroidales bacterium]